MVILLYRPAFYIERSGLISVPVHGVVHGFCPAPSRPGRVDDADDATYQRQPVRRVEIPKATGGTRPLGIPTVLDRFIQQARPM